MKELEVSDFYIREKIGLCVRLENVSCVLFLCKNDNTSLKTFSEIFISGVEMAYIKVTEELLNLIKNRHNPGRKIQSIDIFADSIQKSSKIEIFCDGRPVEGFDPKNPEVSILEKKVQYDLLYGFR